MPALLAVLAVVATLALGAGTQAINVAIPWWVDAPSVMGFYKLIHWLFDNHAWRMGAGALRLSETPDLRGTWAGTLVSTYADRVETPAVVQIHQTWTKIQVHFLGERSRSRSVMASVKGLGLSSGELSYEYVNEPSALSADSMHMHCGAASLHFSLSDLTLSGDYYTGRDRQNLGSMVLHRVSPEIVSREEALQQLSLRATPFAP